MLRTNSNQVKDALKAHVLEHFTKDYGWDSDDTVANLKKQMKPNKHTRKEPCPSCKVKCGSRHSKWCAWAYAKQPGHKTEQRTPLTVKIKSIWQIIRSK
jgi:hypothetical protein